MRPLTVTVPRGQIANINASLEVPVSLVAPLARDKEAGKIRLSLDGKDLGTYPLYPTADVAEAGFFGRLADSAKMWFE